MNFQNLQNPLTFEQFMQMMENMNNNTPFQNLNMSQMMNNPNMMNMMNNNINMNNQMMTNQLMQMMMNMNPALFMNLANNMINNQNNFNFQNNQNNNFQTNQNNNFQTNQDEYYINLFFVVGNEYRISVPTIPADSLSSVINKFINKSGNTDINYYLFNGQRLNESLTVSEQGLNDGSEIFVVKIQNIIGAL